jgi:hypothetical protein
MADTCISLHVKRSKVDIYLNNVAFQYTVPPSLHAVTSVVV